MHVLIAARACDSGKICTRAKHRKDDNALSDSNEGGPTPGLEGAQSGGGTSTVEELQRPVIIIYCPKFGCQPIDGSLRSQLLTPAVIYPTFNLKLNTLRTVRRKAVTSHIGLVRSHWLLACRKMEPSKSKVYQQRHNTFRVTICC